MADLAVIGRGVVGTEVTRLFEGQMSVISWDTQDDVAYPASEINEAKVAIVCVGTPQMEDGSADLSQVHAAVSLLRNDLIMLRSTVPPGTTDELAETYGVNICFWPEFIGESGYYNPYFPSAEIEVPFVTIGGDQASRSKCIDWLLPVLGPTKQYFQCTATEAELAKYAANTFFATKVTFANELQRAADALNADWNTVREAWLLDPRVSPMHTAVFRGNPGFSGRCFPKDLSALIATCQSAGYEPEFLQAVEKSNDRFRAPTSAAGDESAS